MSNWDMWKKIDNKSYVLYVEELYLHPWFIHLISALKPPCFFLKSVEFPGDPWMCSEEIVKQKQTIFQIGTILGLETRCAYDIWHIFFRYLWRMNLVLTIHRRCMMWYHPVFFSRIVSHKTLRTWNQTCADPHPLTRPVCGPWKFFTTPRSS